MKNKIKNVVYAILISLGVAGVITASCLGYMGNFLLP